jgi:hypothetical protein
MDLTTSFMKTTRLRLLAALIFFAPTFAAPFAQEPTAPLDPFAKRIEGVTLEDQSIIDGVAMLGRRAGLAVSVERELGATISASAPRSTTLTATVGPGTVSEVLDGLCALDQAFTWVRNGNTINIVPRGLTRDPNYFLNRRISSLIFREVRGVREAVFQTAEGLPGPKEQVAIMETGTSLDFVPPWSATFQNVSVREVFDFISARLGPTYGWQFGGAQDFRIITFHQALLPSPSPSKHPHPERAGVR